MEYNPPLDKGVSRYVELLNAANVETYESCEGGEGHSYPETTVRFHGGSAEGFRALSVAMQHAMPVRSLRRVWSMIDGEPVGPVWELAFYKTTAT